MPRSRSGRERLLWHFNPRRPLYQTRAFGNLFQVVGREAEHFFDPSGMNLVSGYPADVFVDDDDTGPILVIEEGGGIL